MRLNQNKVPKVKGLFMSKQIVSILIAVMLMPIAVHATTLSDIETAVMEKNYDSARSLSAKMLRNSSDPRDRVPAQYYLALSQLRLGKFADSRKSFTVAMELANQGEWYDKSAIGLIEALNMAGFYQEALKESQQYLDKNPKSSYLSAVYLKMARANMKLMRWQESKQWLDKVINDFPQSMEAPLARQLAQEKQYFAVQVGSFEDKKGAVDLLNDLKQANYYAYLVETTNAQGKTLYRVRVGQLGSLDEAKGLEKQLTKIGYATLIYP